MIVYQSDYNLGKPHGCCVEPSSEELSQTPRMMHPEVALSLAGSSGAPSCVRYISVTNALLLAFSAPN